MQVRHIPDLGKQALSVDPRKSVLEGLTFDASANLVRFPEGTKAIQVSSDPAVQLIFAKLPTDGRLIHLVQRLRRGRETDGSGDLQFIVRESAQIKSAITRLLTDSDCESLGGLNLGKVMSFSPETIQLVDFQDLGEHELVMPRDARGFRKEDDNRQDIFFRSGIGIWTLMSTKVDPPPSIESAPLWNPWQLTDLRPFHVAFKALDEG